MDNKNIELPSLGAVQKPRSLKDHQMLAFAVSAPIFDWTKAPADDSDPQPYVFGIPDKNQGSGGSCTCQSTGYGMFKATGDDISRHDPYSHVFLPGGGAYLNAPLDWFKNQGYVLLGKYPDPDPQTESNMEQIFSVLDGDRVRTFQLSYKISPVVTIDAVAQVIAQYTFSIIGINCSFNPGGWNPSWTDPNYAGNPTGAHALYAGQAVIRNGKKAIKCKSSWCGSRDFNGQANYAHFINEDYFNHGGVFECIGVNVQEITNMEQKFTIQVGTSLGVITITPEGFISGKLAASPAEYSQQGKQLTIKTCDVDTNGNASNFGPVNFTKTA